jgi:hypothetical protein
VVDGLDALRSSGDDEVVVNVERGKGNVAGEIK